MAIRAVVFDIGGILEVIPGGGDPTIRFPEMMAQWEMRCGMEPGELDRRLMAMSERFRSMGKDGGDGTLTEAEWRDEVRLATGWDQPQMDAFMRDFWDVYCGNPNPELAAYFGGLRPRYKTALLSNSFDGARREEEARYYLSQISDFIIYSHEVGVAKPDPRIYAITCERLGAQPHEMIFLDDSPGHIAAAGEYGIHGVVFQNNTQAIADIEALLAAHTA
ncbi:MAG TPA: HAD-IA family hydrolase [Ktedonobacterales bacterium]|nr:HAD-IA family hydrolase [Ktedonobacterales bacterium]